MARILHLMILLPLVVAVEQRLYIILIQLLDLVGVRVVEVLVLIRLEWVAQVYLVRDIMVV